MLERVEVVWVPVVEVLLFAAVVVVVVLVVLVFS